MLKPPQTTRVSDLFDCKEKKKKRTKTENSSKQQSPHRDKHTVQRDTTVTEPMSSFASLHFLVMGMSQLAVRLTTTASPAMLTRHVHTHQAYKTKAQVIHERSGQPLSTLVEKRKELKKENKGRPALPIQEPNTSANDLRRLMIAPCALRETRAGIRNKNTKQQVVREHEVVLKCRRGICTDRPLE